MNTKLQGSQVGFIIFFLNSLSQYVKLFQLPELDQDHEAFHGPDSDLPSAARRVDSGTCGG